VTTVQLDAPADDAPLLLRPGVDGTDRLFGQVLRGTGALVLTVMLLIGVFLAYRAGQALDVAGWSFLTEAKWDPDGGEFGIAAVLTGTVLIGAVAVLFALPLSIGTALYISEYAPRRLQRTLISLVDLMAAVPSVVYGLWGFFLLQNQVTGLSRWLATHFSWVPFFEVEGAAPDDPLATITLYTSSTFIAGLVVSLMVTPIACSVMRESFSQAPLGEREGAYALGATKWGMIRTVVLPFGKGGMIGGMMLGLGRALGETIAVLLVISLVFDLNIRILENGASSVSALIAGKFGEASPTIGISALMAAGLALFLVTLVINFAASSIVARSRSGAQSEV
jgi:phosphate transport system permease protein